MIALNVNSIISLGQNIAFLLCVPLLCHFLWLLLKTAPKYVKDIATALAFAFIAIIGMLSPLHVFEGLIVDGRIPLIMVATLYSTPTGFIAALLICGVQVPTGWGWDAFSDDDYLIGLYNSGFGAAFPIGERYAISISKVLVARHYYGICDRILVVHLTDTCAVAGLSIEHNPSFDLVSGLYPSSGKPVRPGIDSRKNRT